MHMLTYIYAYMAMLQEAINDLRAQQEDDEHTSIDPELKVAVEGRIPESWLPETTLRLRLYKQFASAKTPEQLYEMFGNAVDRYGNPPPSVRNLLELVLVKLKARKLCIGTVGYNENQLKYSILSVLLK